MLQLIGLNHNVELSIRQKFSVIPKHLENFLDRLLEFCEEAVVLSTCNRTEVYFISEEQGMEIVSNIFEALNWEKALIGYTFHKENKEVYEHLLEVACGFDSIILGEDQILGQIRTAYESALNSKSISGDLQRLFEIALACGKEFRHESGISNIPVSSSSIIVKKAIEKGIKSFMIMGYGEVGELTVKYVLEEDIDELYIVVRDINSVKLHDPKVKVIPFGEAKNYFAKVECIIACTSAPHSIVKKEELPDKKLLIFDLAVPRNVQDDVYAMKNIEIYDIDKVTLVHNEKLKERRKLMLQFEHIMRKHIKEFMEWKSSREINESIRRLKQTGENVYRQRYKTFTNKKDTKDADELVKVLLKSTSDAYVNRAIEVLKEEHWKGRGEECLRIMEKIFFPMN